MQIKLNVNFIKVTMYKCLLTTHTVYLCHGACGAGSYCLIYDNNNNSNNNNYYENGDGL